MPTPAAVKAEETLIHVLWINAGLSCDGDSVALTAATQPSIEEIALGALPWSSADRGALAVDRLRVRARPAARTTSSSGSAKPTAASWNPSSSSSKARSPTRRSRMRATGAASVTIRRPGSRSQRQEWLDRLAPKATAIVAAGTCATYGGIHAMAGNPTGAMGVADYLGWGWKSKAGIPIVNVPGCPIQPDNLSETLTYLLYMATDQAPMIPLDDALRPTWLFGATVHEGCDRAGYYEQADFATEYGSPKCIVKLGCWGPVVKCNVPKRGWMNGDRAAARTSAASALAARCRASPTSSCPSWTSRPARKLSTTVVNAWGGTLRRLRARDPAHDRQGTQVA